MNSVTMDKGKLLAIVQANKERHRQLYHEAHEAFMDKAIKNFEELLGRAKRGHVKLYVDLVEPKDHTKDYERVVLMLEHEVGDTIELTSREFAQYVQDEWGWQEEFSTAYLSNTGKEAGR